MSSGVILISQASTRPGRPDFSDRHVDLPGVQLHDDLLWRIFMVNAWVEDEDDFMGQRSRHQSPALNTARFSSQVCQQWRAVILGSPPVWANIIDLDQLRQHSDHWRNEVIKRTGSAPLWISGDVLDDNNVVQTFFFFLFNEHWERIRGVDVRVFGLYLESTDCETWKSLRRPAPNLEVFRIDFQASFDSDPSPLNFFSGNAPLIREFYCPFVAFSVSAQWIPQLRAIRLSYPLSTHDLFAVLINMPLLESLEIEDSLRRPDFRGPDTADSMIYSPRLKRIAIYHRFKTCLLILRHIIPSPECALLLATDDSGLADITNEQITAFQAVLSQYSKGYFNAASRTTDELILHLHQNNFAVSLPANACSPTRFIVNIYSAFNLPLDIFPFFMRSFSSYNFSSVANFHALISLNYKTCRSDIIHFLSALPSVEVLHVTKNTLRLLLDLPKEQRNIFPFLHTLTLEYRECINSTIQPAYHDILLSFLRLRRDVETPVQVLDLTACDLNTLGNLEILEEMVGMKIQWKNGEIFQEYICGSGKPKTIDLRTNIWLRPSS